MFGRVPFFYHLLRIPLIHGAAIIVSLLRIGHVEPWLFANNPMLNPPAPRAYTWSLWLLYLVWVVVMIGRFFACLWWAGRKKAKP